MRFKMWIREMFTSPDPTDEVARLQKERQAQEMRRHGWALAGKGVSADYVRATASGGTAVAPTALGAPPTPPKR